jgi:photosystem II stability/assembly factor-like uncharacterized protein
MAWNPMSCTQIALLTLGLGSAVVGAQEEVLPEQAVQAPLAGRSLLLDAAAADGLFVVVGGRGHILTSDDKGESWQQMEVPTRAALTGVDFYDRNLGLAVGHDAVILRTTDGGTTWEQVHWAPEEENPLFDVWFSDADNGFAIGAYGSFYRTSDGGETWQFEPISEWDFHLHQIARSGDGRLYLAAEAGVIYRSDDGGESWIELPSPYEGSFFGILPLDEESVLIFGLQGHLFRSDDAGETWEELDTGTSAMLTDGLRLGDGTIVITGLGGAILTSEDGGQSFELIQQPDRRGISAMVDAGDGQLLLVGEFGAKMLSVSDLAK